MAVNPNITKDEAIRDLYTISKKYPGKQSIVISMLPDYGISIDEFNDYDSLMTSYAQLQEDEKVDSLNTAELSRRASALREEGAPESFSQVENMSDEKILTLFKSKDDLLAEIADIGEPPRDAEWYTSGVAAANRIAALRPFYETKKAEEWEELEYPTDILSPLMGPLGVITEMVAGGMDLRHDFKEDLHERGFLTSANPLTGFGAWDLAEFRKNPRTGQTGFSPELLAMEEELDVLYGTAREFKENIGEGGWGEVGALEGELSKVQDIIDENRLLDPRIGDITGR